MRPFPTLGTTVALLCALVGSLIAGRWPGPVRAAQPQLSAGALEGLVRWTGDGVPQPTAVENSTDPDVCGRMHTLEDLLVSDENGGLTNVIVALVDVPAGTGPSRAPGRLLLDNVDCRFSPHVSVFSAGSQFETRNSDPTLHTTHLYGPSEANLAMPLQGMTLSYTVDQTGMFIIKCDVHGWMQAFIRVDDHPYHAVTDGSGFFRITDVPAGKYTLEAWHEKLGTQQRTVRIRDAETTTIALEFSESGQ